MIGNISKQKCSQIYLWLSGYKDGAGRNISLKCVHLKRCIYPEISKTKTENSFDLGERLKPFFMLNFPQVCVGSLLCYGGFSPGSPVFLPPQKPNTFDLKLCFVIIYGLMWLAAKGRPWKPATRSRVAPSFIIHIVIAGNLWKTVCVSLSR